MIKEKSEIFTTFLHYKQEKEIGDLSIYRKAKKCYVHLIHYSLKNKLASKEHFIIFKLNIISAILS